MNLFKVENQIPTTENRFENGQIVIVLLLIMLVALSLGLVITQRSINDVTTSSQTEQFSRAFSAAEAGIEKALYQNAGSTISESELGNQSSAQAKVANCLPRAGQALEYPPIGKETIAQFWLMNPSVPGCTGSSYSGSFVYLYFGNDTTTDGSTDIPAVEVNLISYNGSSYISTRRYIDPVASRQRNNGFEPLTCIGATVPINTTNSVDTTTLDRQFKCRITISTLGATPIMLRVRILYSDKSQKIAVTPQSGRSLPPQAAYYTSVGSSGNSQKTLQLFKVYNVAPQFFDYSIFAASEVRK